ncbi:MAG TPA: hypothetical protein VFU28_11160 [Vicinamibacterales bacterium]|nr:hypothetical protein [Vicinamibacterales bacterium]
MPHVPAVVTTLGKTPAIVGCGPVGVGDGTTTEGVADGDTDGVDGDEGPDGEDGSPPQAAAVNASSRAIPVSFKFALAL